MSTTRPSPANTAIAVLAAVALFALLLALAVCVVLRSRERRSASDEPLLDGTAAPRRRSRFGLMTLSEYERAGGEVVELPRLRPAEPERVRLGTWARFHAFLG
ncbi:hypothetical protein AURDEDRAFT_165424 [Auricularia subglabra TFB-10046 SS5]|nr:hypothetical protein AURDEDRAFT_165424 [Auricularia subglabra TFB-10046 SS5]